MGDTAPAGRWTGQRRACAAGSYEVTPSDRLVSGECPSRADESNSGQSKRTSAGFDGVRPGSGTHPHADQFSLRSGGPSAVYLNPRCRLGGDLDPEAFAASACTIQAVFERSTDRARRVLQLAQEEALLFNHSVIGTKHLLLGVIQERDGVGAQALRSLGISHQAVLEKVAETIGTAGTAPSGALPFTPRAKKVLELAFREALQLNHRYIGTEHILLGLIREGEGVAATVLVSLGSDLGRVRQEVISLISDAHESDATARPEASEPLCIRCRASVSNEARFRTIEVNPDAGNPSRWPSTSSTAGNAEPPCICSMWRTRAKRPVSQFAGPGTTSLKGLSRPASTARSRS